MELTGASMPLPFEFIVPGPPVSQQARRRALRDQWMQEVRRAAALDWGAEPAFANEVMVTILYFFDGSRLDVDNIPKPILDALTGLVYADDGLVTDLVCRARQANGNLMLDDATDLLRSALRDSGEFLYIRIENSPVQEVTP